MSFAMPALSSPVRSANLKTPKYLLLRGFFLFGTPLATIMYEVQSSFCTKCTKAVPQAVE